MKRTQFSDEQIIGILQEHEAGAKCAVSMGCRMAHFMHGSRSFRVCIARQIIA